jgi:predicted acyl esterase
VLLGHPVARLVVAADAPAASLSVKLCDVFPDGTSALVTRGQPRPRLPRRRPRARGAAPLAPGRAYEVEVQLDACAYQPATGHRLRLSVAGADWPNTVAPPARSR